MKKIISVVLSLILIISITMITHATIKGNVGDNSTYVSVEEFNQWKESVEDWFDYQLGLDLLNIVASRCEVHGFYPPEKKEGEK